MSRARNLAGFVTAISPVTDLNCGIVSAIRFVGPFDVEVGLAQTAQYAQVAGIATLAQGISGTPNINVGDINASGTVSAASFEGDGSLLTGIGGGLGDPVPNTDGFFNTVALTTSYNATITLDDSNAGVGSHFVTVTEPILEVGATGDITVGADKILVVDPVQLAPWS